MVFLTMDRALATPVSFRDGYMLFDTPKDQLPIFPHYIKFLEGRGLSAAHSPLRELERGNALRQILQVPAEDSGFHIQWNYEAHPIRPRTTWEDGANALFIGIADGELCVSATPATLHLEEAPPTEVELLREQLAAAHAEIAALRASM
jgi:hypothetical protein